MTPAELKRLVESAGTEPHFFDRASMRFFGDTMKNYAVTSKPVTITTYSGETHACYELRRKRPVKNGLQSSVYFDTTTLKRVISKGD